LRRRDFALLLTAVFTVSLGYGVVLPVLPFFLARVLGERGSVSWHTGMLAAAYMFAVFIGAPLAGRIADQIGRRPVILVGLGGFSAALLVFGFSASLWVGYAARIAGGSFAAAVLPVALAYVSDTTVAASRARRFAWMSAASVMGFLAGPSVGGWLAGVSGTGSIPATALPFLTVASLGALVWIFAWRCLSEPPAPVRAATRAPMPRTTRLLLVLSLFVTFGIGGFEVGLTLHGQQHLKLSPAELGLMFFECSLVMAIVDVLLFAPFADRFDGRAALAAAFAVMAIGLGWLAGATTSNGLLWRVGVIAASSGFILPLLTYRVSLAAGAAQAAMLGRQTAATSLGQALGSAAAGWLFGAIGAAFFWVTAAVLIVGAGVVLAGGRSSRAQATHGH
jgi:MFS family permease